MKINVNSVMIIIQVPLKVDIKRKNIKMILIQDRMIMVIIKGNSQIIENNKFVNFFLKINVNLVTNAIIYIHNKQKIKQKSTNLRLI